MKNQHSGVTLLELMIALVIVSILSMIAIPSYQEYKKDSEEAKAMSDISSIAEKIERYWILNHKYPDTLADIGVVENDPWGEPYQYLNFDNVKGNGNGKVRKDKNLTPLNSDYDLYSMGPDRKSTSPLTAKHSRDDIIRANNGKFIGIAEDY